MTHKEFVKATAADVNKNFKASGKSTLSEATVGEVLNSGISVVKDALAKNEKVAIFGFGSFECTRRGERIGRNPLTGEQIKIASKNAPKFKAAKALKDALN